MVIILFINNKKAVVEGRIFMYDEIFILLIKCLYSSLCFIF